jgi:NAD-dependent SIR2 family protein deacetylase
MDATKWHGTFCGSGSWPNPIKTSAAEVDSHAARPGYATTSASEFHDSASVLNAKAAVFIGLLRSAKHVVAYTGAGISTAAGISDYATVEKSTLHALPVTNPFLAEPTFGHYALTSLFHAGMLHSWVQQNHDGLAQKAGFPQSALNEIHGSLFDPTNPVVQMHGALRSDLFNELLELERKADLVLVLGSSLSGMNADRIVSSVAARAAEGRTGGAVICGLQATPFDSVATLRIFATIDEFMTCVLVHAGLPAPSPKLSPMAAAKAAAVIASAACAAGKAGVTAEEMPVDVELPSVFFVPYDPHGRRLPALPDGSPRHALPPLLRLDLSEGSHLRIPSGDFAGDAAEVQGLTAQGHFKLQVGGG